jgi:hypothetical protein
MESSGPLGCGRRRGSARDVVGVSACGDRRVAVRSTGVLGCQGGAKERASMRGLGRVGLRGAKKVRRLESPLGDVRGDRAT